MTANIDPQLNATDLELLSAYIDRQLAADDRIALERRLEHDPAFLAALEELRATVGLLRDLPPARPPRSFALDPQAVAPKRAWSFPWMQLGSALVAMTLLVVFGFALSRSTSPSSSTAGAPIAASAPTSAPAADAQMAVGETSAPAAAVPAAPEAAPMIAAEPAATPAAAAAGGVGALQTPPAAADSANSAGAAGNPPSSALKAATNAPAEPSTSEQPASAGAARATAAPFNAQIATSGSSSPDTLDLEPAPTPTAGAAGAPQIAGVFGIVLLVAVAGGLALLFLRRQR